MKVTYKTLVIASDAAVRGELVAALAEAGFATAAGSDLSEGRRQFEAFAPDIVVVGEYLSSGDAVEACRKVHEDFGVPVVLVGTAPARTGG